MRKSFWIQILQHDSATHARSLPTNDTFEKVQSDTKTC